MGGAYPGMPKVQMAIVDVREVALAHLQGLKVPEAKNKRFILSSGTVWFKQIAEVLKNQYPQFNVKDRELPYCPVKLASYFDKSVKSILPMWGKNMTVDNKQSREILNITYKEPAESIIAMAESLFDAGVIQRKAAKM